jgi:U2 small nuclear ribonucleoprotein B''
VIEALRETLEPVGEIVDVIAKKNLKAKGQAFVVFSSVEEAQDAIEAFQEFELFGKPITMKFAKTRSDATVLKEEGEEGLEKHKRHRLAEKGE